MDEHKNFLRSKHPKRPDDWITREQTRSFAGWLQTRTMHDGSIEEGMYSLSQLPSLNIMTYKGYEINGNTFYTIAQDKKSTNQNSGVRFDAETKTGKETYYGYIQDIWELDYRRGLKVPLFPCKLVNMTRGGGTEDPQYGMTKVDLKTLVYVDEPFVLANDVAQVFYVKGMSTKPRKRKDKEANASYDEPKRHIVLSRKRNIVGVDDKTDMTED